MDVRDDGPAVTDTGVFHIGSWMIYELCSKPILCGQQNVEQLRSVMEESSMSRDWYLKSITK